MFYVTVLARYARRLVGVGLVASLLAGPATTAWADDSASVARFSVQPPVTAAANQVGPKLPIGIRPPRPPQVPSPLVTVSEGVRITAQDIAKFDAQWMQPAQRKSALDGAAGSLAWRFGAGAWGTGERMASLARMYELTHERRYLDHLREFIEFALQYRDDKYPGNPDPTCSKCPARPIDELRGRNVAAWSGASVSSGGFNFASEVVASVYAYPIAAFARIVAEDPSLQATYGKDAVRYANAALQTAWVFMPQLETRSVGNAYVNYLTQLDIYRTKPSAADCSKAHTDEKSAMDEANRQALAQGQPPVYPQASYDRLGREKTNCDNLRKVAGAPLAYNENHAFMMLNIELWRALDSDFYRRSPDRASGAELTRTLVPILVSRHQRYFVNHLETKADNKGERYYWHHQDDQPSGVDIHAEDTSHAALDMRYIDVLRRSFDRLNAVAAPRGEPILLESVHLKRFANTFLQKIAATTNFARDVGGAPGKPDADGLWWDNALCDGWLDLTVADANVYRLCREVSLRILNGAQPYLTIGSHSGLLMNKRFSRQVNRLDLTGASRARPAAGDPFGYVYDAQGGQNVVYRATDGHVHELWRKGTAIGHSNLSAFAGAPTAVGNPMAYLAPTYGEQVVPYRGTDGHLHGLYWSTGAVGRDNLTALARAPKLVGNPVGYFVGARGEHVVVYRGTDGHLHAVYWTTGAVGHTDLTRASGAPAPAGDAAPYVATTYGEQVVVYRGTDGHLHGLYWSTGAIGHDNLTALARAPRAVGNPSAYFMAADGTHHVIYRSANGHLHELWWTTGAVTHHDLTAVAAAPLAAGNPTAYVAANGTQHVIYRSRDSHLHELSWTTGPVSHTDLSALSGAAPATGDPSAYFVAADGTHHVIYRAGGGHLHELKWKR